MAAIVNRAATRFVMPAESTLHLRTLMAWPGTSSCYPHQLAAARREVKAVADAISRFEPVTLFANSHDFEYVQSMASSNINVVEQAVHDPWIRDFGPTFVKGNEGSLFGVDFNFNYWGGKFPPRLDVNLAERILADSNTTRIQANIQAEGGGLEVDGEMTLLATESCLVNPNRNAGVSKETVAGELRSLLGVEKIIWLRGLRDFDITDCHIDALARFVSPNTVVLSRPNASRPDAWIAVYEEAKKTLELETNANGRRLHIVDLAEPRSIESRERSEPDMIASYANYYLANGAVVIPCFGDNKADQAALEIIRDLYPEREVLQVFLNMLPKLGGGIHCITQQVPCVT